MIKVYGFVYFMLQLSQYKIYRCNDTISAKKGDDPDIVMYAISENF